MRKRDDLPFPMHEYERRLRGLRERMDRDGFGTLLITTPENICYLTGFESPGYFALEALIVPLNGEPVMVSRRLEASGVESRTWIEHCHPYEEEQDPVGQVVDVIRAYGLTEQRFGFERDGWFFTATEQDRLFRGLPETRFIDCSGIVEEGRLIKSDLEIEVMRRAARFAEAGMLAGIEAVGEGVTENEIAAEIHHAMFRAGGEWPAISPFVASGHRGSIGHATWENHRLAPGMCVFLEVGGCLKRYHSALMRTCFVGEPPAYILDAAQTVIDAQQASIDVIKPGMTLGEVDAVSRAVISEACPRFLGTQVTRSAYSIGIAFPPDWGEGHIMSIRHEDPRVLRPNMTFHNIPWVQLPGRGGIGFSETIRVTEDGCETLTRLERRLFVK
ncbi:MAG: M24 family metallopeptidase [Acidimicrobiia bacterium]|nr:M24 family metallopeptidase [Acidimicrobiia bacterium]